MSKITLLYPLDTDKIKITSPWGMRNGILHSGADLHAIAHTPIVAPADGVCTSVLYDDKSGNYFTVSHKGVLYKNAPVFGGGAHCEKILIKKGDVVKVGQLIAYSGFTGHVIPAGAGGAHLHYEMGFELTPYGYIKKDESFNPMTAFNWVLKKDWKPAPPPKPVYKPRTGIVTASVLNVREKPTTDSEVISTVHHNDKVVIIAEQNGFGKLKTGGWVSLKYIKF